MLQPGRQYEPANSYRFGFNGKENDDEVKAIPGSQQDYGMRIYDPRIARFLSVDPITKQFPMLTPYQFASNTPIGAIDLDGLEAHWEGFYDKQGKVTAIHITIDIQVLNLTANYSDATIMDLAQGTADQMASSMQGNAKWAGYKGVSVTTEVKPRLVSNPDERVFSLTFRDEGTNGFEKDDKILGLAAKQGNTQKNNSDIYLGTVNGQDPSTPAGAKKVAITASHEKGHELGLGHYDKDVNLMNTLDNGQNNQTDLISKQLSKIIRKIGNQQPEPEPEVPIEEIELGPTLPK